MEPLFSSNCFGTGTINDAHIDRIVLKDVLVEVDFDVLQNLTAVENFLLRCLPFSSSGVIAEPFPVISVRV